MLNDFSAARAIVVRDSALRDLKKSARTPGRFPLHGGTILTWDISSAACVRNALACQDDTVGHGGIRLPERGPASACRPQFRHIPPSRSGLRSAGPPPCHHRAAPQARAAHADPVF